VPFELVRGIPVVPIQVGDGPVLRIVLDTGMGFDGVLVYDPVTDSAFLAEADSVLIPGAGAGEPARGLMAESASFRAGPVEFKDQRLICLVDGTMDGMPSQGVTGYSFFGHWTVEMDYDRQTMVLHEPGEFEPDSSWTVVPIEIRRNNMPWLKLRASMTGQDSVELDCYLDLPARETVEFLVREEMRFELPGGLEEAYLGRGLSGDIHGWTGQVAWVELDTFRFEDLDVAFAPAQVRTKQIGGEAVVGGLLLGRFNVVYDYAGEKLYVRRRKG
jgi:hypothetical protein